MTAAGSERSSASRADRMWSQPSDAGDSDSHSGTVRLIAWTGLLLPSAFVVHRAGEAVLEDPFVATSLFRGIVPVVALLAAWLVSRSPLRPLDAREWSLATYLAIAFVSVIWSVAPQATLLKAGHLAISYALIVLLARHWRDRRHALDELATVVYGIVLIAAATAIFAPEAAFGHPSGRLFSVVPYLHAVGLGMVSALAVLMLVGRAGPDYIRQSLPLRASLILVAIAVLLLTRTLSALILVTVGLSLFLGLARRWRSLLGFLGSLCSFAVIALAGPWRSAVLEVVFRGRSFTTVASLSHRIPMWGDALDVGSTRALGGFGYYAGHRFGPYADMFQHRFGDQRFPVLDGTWVMTYLELGAVGVVSLSAFVGICLWRSVKKVPLDENYGALHVSLLLVLFVFSIADATLEQVAYPMVIFGGALLARPRSPRPFVSANA